ncbi:hypothetical protein NI17_019525 [Thermobifida halotolerans]|uniref:Uncharacterized protein n=1 Tax=Thermobifida halotolerans TaxID=483545 RepID=A0A399FW81_9ACTN|nr:hypothetical protein [Thermobifida halotolerans]UOE18936.1 hypothetical protein NI17_019525 [Thermobifida halotolerans]
MAVALQRRQARKEAEEALSRFQEMAREQAERLTPYTTQAREAAALRIQQARGWTAPRLQTAAQRVEDTVAPRVAGLLNTAAQKVEPVPVVRRRRVPRTLVYVGVGAVGLAAVYGVLRLRQATQDAEWQANLENAREQVRHTREQLAAKARETRERLMNNTATSPEDEKTTQGATEGSSELNGRVKR